MTCLLSTGKQLPHLGLSLSDRITGFVHRRHDRQENLTSLVITGANGKLGRAVVAALLRRGVPASDIIATGRTASSMLDLADQGVDVRTADFADPASLTAAFAGATKVLLVSAARSAPGPSSTAT